MLRNALRTRYALIVALALYIACTAAWAGQLTGKVTDDAGVGLLARVTVIQYESRNSAVGFTLPDGTFSLDVPDGELSVLAAHGPEWSIAEVTAHAGDVLNLVLHRLVDMPSYGYYGADLHMHSTFSDGTQPVEVMASACRAEGLHIAALTDHDTVDQHGLWLQQATPDFLPLRGQEITTSTMGHFLGINGPTLVSRDVSGGEEDMSPDNPYNWGGAELQRQEEGFVGATAVI